MACRLPGGVTSPEDLWRLVGDEVDAVDGFPTNRGWDLDALSTPTRTAPARPTPPEGGFPHDARTGSTQSSSASAPARRPRWSPSSGCSWRPPGRPSSSAGIDPTALRGTRTGVYVGATAQEYGAAAARRRPGGHDGYLLTGNTASVASGPPRLHLRTRRPGGHRRHRLLVLARRTAPGRAVTAPGRVLRWPSPAACPSWPPLGMFVEFSRQRGLSPRTAAARRSPRRRTARAGPRAWACSSWSGCRTPSATGHQVLAVIRGCAVNQDGASNGLTAPNGPLPGARVIRAALADAAPVRVRRGRGGGARHRYPARRPDRGQRTAGHLRPGNRDPTTAAARLVEVEHRSHAGRRGRRGRDQDGHGDAQRRPARDAARGRADRARRLVGRRGGTADAGRAVARARPSAPGGRLVLRHQRAPTPTSSSSRPRRPWLPLRSRRRRARCRGWCPRSRGAALSEQAGRLVSFLEERPELDVAAVGRSLAVSRGPASTTVRWSWARPARNSWTHCAR